MSEVVSKEDYWQIILNDPSKVGQITTDDEKFNKIADFVYTVVQNTLLTSEDEDYLKKYEEMIDISGEGLTPYQRKVNILYMLSGKNYIPLNLVRRGLINMGVSAFDIELLKDENKLVVHTDRVDETQFEGVTALLELVLPKNLNIERYNHHIEISWRDIPPGIPLERINKYDSCVTQDDLSFINTGWKSDTYTVSGAKDWFSERYPECAKSWASDILYLYTFSSLSEVDFSETGSTNICWLWCPELTKLNGNWAGHTGDQFFYFYAPKLKRVLVSGKAGFGGYFPNATYFQHQSAANGENGETECYAEFPALERGIFTTSWTKTKFSKKSALRILNSIPSYASDTHSLSIGIHIDHQTDDEVLEAIAIAESKGWTLEVQWNGTPTAQASTTYGLRKLPIYARVGEMERLDGIIERILDWGHYVTNPEDYQEFSSLEEAYIYFNLEIPQTEE